jgi:nucleotidyltransferase substrate binding protein (TIGR01987 family)
MLDLTSLEKAAGQLEKALRFAIHARQNGEAELFEQFRNSVIQTFEYTYELSCKLMRRSLIERAASADEIESLSFQDTIREAARAGLLDDPERWFVFRTIRNKTSHAYDEAYASEAYATAVDFLPRAQNLLTRLRGA